MNPYGRPALKKLPLWKLRTRSEIAFLKRVRRMLAAGWTRGEWARDTLGATNELSPNACRVCLAGAGNRADVTTRGRSNAGARRLAKLLKFKTSSAMVSWNDNHRRTNDQVISRIDAAIARLSGV